MNSKDPGPGMTGHLRRPPILATQPAVRANPNSPNMSHCQRCGARRAELHFFPSNWRLVILCDGCLTSINSAEACSYCFSNFATRDHIASLNCDLCHRQVHPGCILSYHCFRPLPYRNSFTCIDCCPYASPRPSLLTEKSNSVEQSGRQLQRAPNSLQIGVAESDEQSGRRLQAVPNGSQSLESKSYMAESDKQLGHLLQSAPNSSQSLETNSGGVESDEQFSRQLQPASNSSQSLLSCWGQQKLNFKRGISEDTSFFKQIKSIMSEEGRHYRLFDSSCKDNVGCVSDSRPKEQCASYLLDAAVIREESQSGKCENPCKDVEGCESETRPEELAASGSRQDSCGNQDLHSKKYFRKTLQEKGIMDIKECSQTRCLEEPETGFQGKNRYSNKYSRKPRQLKGMVDPEEIDTAQMSSMEHEIFYDVSTLCYVNKFSRSH